MRQSRENEYRNEREQEKAFKAQIREQEQAERQGRKIEKLIEKEQNQIETDEIIKNNKEQYHNYQYYIESLTNLHLTCVNTDNTDKDLIDKIDIEFFNRKKRRSYEPKKYNFDDYINNIEPYNRMPFESMPESPDYSESLEINIAILSRKLNRIIMFCAATPTIILYIVYQLRELIYIVKTNMIALITFIALMVLIKYIILSIKQHNLKVHYENKFNSSLNQWKEMSELHQLKENKLEKIYMEEQKAEKIKECTVMKTMITNFQNEIHEKFELNEEKRIKLLNYVEAGDEQSYLLALASLLPITIEPIFSYDYYDDLTTYFFSIKIIKPSSVYLQMTLPDIDITVPKVKLKLNSTGTSLATVELNESERFKLYNKYIYSVAFRHAYDVMRITPNIANVIIDCSAPTYNIAGDIEDKLLLQVDFDKITLAKIDFTKTEPMNAIKLFKHKSIAYGTKSDKHIKPIYEYACLDITDDIESDDIPFGLIANEINFEDAYTAQYGDEYFDNCELNHKIHSV
jgi:hypothetical protein